jgi:hypothetical protein
MSDDFMSDISAAVDNGGTLPVERSPAQTTEPAKTNPVIPQVKPEVIAPSSVADELTNMFKNNDPHNPVEKTKKDPVEKAKEPAKTSEAKVEGEEKNNNSQTPSRTQRKGNEKLLDTFLNEDENGNLVNDAGEIIALAGKSRTYYEGLKNEARKQRKAATDLAVSNMQLAQQFKNLYDEYKGIADISTSPIQSIVRETGFSEPEAKEAVQLLKLYKADPIAAIKNMLTQAKMSGIDISKIGANISVDPAIIRNTIQSVLDERLKPLSDKAEQETAEQSANREAQTFLQTYPEARQFTSAIAQAKQQFPQMSLPEIWLRLRRELEKRPSRTSQSVTKHRQAPARRTQPAAKAPAVKAPVRDYAKMSFEAIKNSIIEDFNQ